MGWLIFALLALGTVLLTVPEHLRRWPGMRPGAGRSAMEQEPPRDQGIQDVPLMLELLATSLESGLPMVRALEVLADVATYRVSRGLAVVVAGLTVGASWQTSWSAVLDGRELARLHAALTFSALTGSASSSLLYAEAARLRRTALREAEMRAGALGVKLVVPLGLCSLPAFICLGVAPVVLAMVPAFQ